MPSYANRLKDRSYPGGGVSGGMAAHCDPRRRNGWISYPLPPAAQRASLAAASLGVVLSHARESSLVSAEEASIASLFSSLPPRGREACALAWRAGGGWVRLSHAERPGGESAECEASREDLDEASPLPRFTMNRSQLQPLAPLAQAVGGGLLEPLRRSAMARELPSLLPLLSRLRPSQLRQILSAYSLAPPVSSWGAGGSLRGEAAPSLSRSANEGAYLALVACLGRRRLLDGAHLEAALGPCVAMPVHVHRCSLLFFTSAGFAPEEAATMLQGLTPVPRTPAPSNTRDGMGAMGDTHNGARGFHRRFSGRAELLSVERCIAMADAAEDLCCTAAAAGAYSNPNPSCDSNSNPKSNANATASPNAGVGEGEGKAAGDSTLPHAAEEESKAPCTVKDLLEEALSLMQANHNPVGLASLCRVIDACCAHLRRTKRNGESIRALREALQVETSHRYSHRTIKARHKPPIALPLSP
ncbi:MAG: hypothetical protein SGPRY_001445 [Prymnesium sp.]